MTVGAWCSIAAELAVIAAERGDAERAGRLWGAIESEMSPGPSHSGRATARNSKTLVLGADGLAFSRARGEGSLMSIVEAAGLIPAG